MESLHGSARPRVHEDDDGQIILFDELDVSLETDKAAHVHEQVLGLIGFSLTIWCLFTIGSTWLIILFFLALLII